MITEAVETQLVELYREVSGPTEGVALAAVGSLARRELGPRSDIDLVLLHDGKHPKINKLADQLWYPLWDSGIRLDHSVRTPAECADVAGRELSAGVGLLDLRAIAGDAALVRRARTALLDTWRGNARKRLPELLSALAERHESFGDAAYLLEPDLKEARGGLPGHDHAAGSGRDLADRPSARGRTRPVRAAARRAGRAACDRRPGPGPTAARRGLRGREPDGLRRSR